VGAVSHSDYPPQVRDLPRIGDAVRLDRERIIALAPDLAVAWTSGNRQADLDWLAARPVRLYLSDPQEIGQIPSDLIAIGRLAGTEDQARDAANGFRGRLAALRAHRSKAPRLRAFYLLWDRPLMTLGGPSLITRVMELCGLTNLFADQPVQALSITQESLLTARPQVIVRPRDTPPSEDSIQRLWPGKAPSVIVVDTDLLYRPGPRLIQGAEQLCRAVETLRRANASGDTRPPR